MHDVEIELSTTRRSEARRREIVERPVFGQDFTDHMITMPYVDGAWGPLRLEPFGPLALSPATLALHYGQAIFEALKAYRSPEGEPVIFRPDRNAARMAASAQRMAMPTLPEGVFETSCAMLAEADRDWIPSEHGAALYLRPFMFASEAHLSVRPAQQYLFVLIACPVASYFGHDVAAITVAVERREVRAAPGGTGAAKFAGNYAAGFAAHGRAGAAGLDQVLWLDAVEHRWIEELNAMNVMFVWRRGQRTELSTPPLSGTILDGVTRSSLLELARRSAGQIDDVLERPTSIEQVLEGVRSGELLEAFACGTAAVVAPIGTLVDGEHHVVIGDGGPGPVTMQLRRAMLDVQHARAAGPDGWVVPVSEMLARASIEPSRLRDR